MLNIVPATGKRDVILKDYWPSVRSVPWNIGLRFFSTDRASAASEVRTKNTEVRYFTVQTEQERSINCLLYGSSYGGHFAFINNFDGFLVYYNKFNRQKFDISLYCTKVIKFLS